MYEKLFKPPESFNSIIKEGRKIYLIESIRKFLLNIETKAS